MGISDSPRKSTTGINVIYTAALTAQTQLLIKAGETPRVLWPCFGCPAVARRHDAAAPGPRRPAVDGGQKMQTSQHQAFHSLPGSKKTF